MKVKEEESDSVCNEKVLSHALERERERERERGKAKQEARKKLKG